ncbi:MAG: protein kinase [Candidatus Aminicenantes bacterium]|jgi:serine/threonine-protein kinase
MKCPKCQFDNPENTRFCGNCASPLSIPDETLEAQTETLATPMPDIIRGTVLNERYEIVEEIGKGGMGKVYKAFDRDIDEYVALKIIRPEIASDEKTISRFKNELKLARKISHRNVCRMYDLGKDGDTKYISMEYISGEDLKKSIRRMGSLTIRKTVAIGKQICQGLVEAHRLGVFHRDLKPHNIMIDREGNARIMDFGIARFPEAKGITDAGMMIGTPHYLSPEQVEGKDTDHRSDLYSLGIILFEMVTGSVPFDGDTTLSIAVKHKTEMPRDPREFNNQIPGRLSQLILRCLEKDPIQRYQSAEDLCIELTQVEEDLPTTETAIIKEKTRFRPITWSQKPSRFWATLLLPILIIIAGYFFYDLILKKESPSAGLTEETRQMNSIVVLPFKDLSPESDEAPFSLMITDMLIVNLHALKEFRVMSLTSALAYQDSGKSVQTIGDELNVNNILEGTILKSEENLRVTTQLSRAADGSVIWAQSFEGARDNALKIQEDITKRVAKTLGIKNVEEKLFVKTATAHTEMLTNESYLRGRHYEISYYSSNDPADFDKCVQNYLNVVSSNPEDALTYWRLGNVHEARFIDEAMDERYLDLMFEYFQKAFEIDPNFAEANCGMGWSFFYKKDNANAYRFMKRAYEIDPNNAEVNFLIGSFFRSIGLLEQALRHYSRGLEIDPMPLEFVLWHNLRADCACDLGRFEESLEYMRDVMEIQPDREFHIMCAWSLMMMGNYKEAETQIMEAEKWNPDSSRIRLYRAMILAAKGKRPEALELIHDNDIAFRYPITCTYSILGMDDDVIDNILLGIDKGFETIGMYLYTYPFLATNPFYDNLRGDPRFQEILEIEKEKYEEMLRKFGKF